jgi:shikimate kinase
MTSPNPKASPSPNPMTRTNPRTNRKIVLIGPPGAGKSSVASVLAGQLGTAFRDTDADVARAAGKPVGDIFLEDGEQAFRELERQASTEALRSDAGVIALGSGAVLDAAVRRALADAHATVVYLHADAATVVRHAGLDRPRVVLPGNPRGRLRAMVTERHPLYESLATITVEADDSQDPDELAAHIATELAR